MEDYNRESLKRYIKKKGVEYFLNAPEEEKKALNGILYFKGHLSLSVIESIAHVS